MDLSVVTRASSREHNVYVCIKGVRERDIDARDCAA